MKGNNYGMGMRKHGKSGHSGKSPKLRHSMKREAEKEERKKRKDVTIWKKTVREL